jgi:REP element-mobilizing transposase RayT
MPTGSIFPHRRSIRLKGYDYTSNGAYFITFCTMDRRHLFGTIRNAALDATPAGRIVNERWLALPEHHPGVVLDAFVVMPDHVHGIIIIDRPAPPPSADETPIETDPYFNGSQLDGLHPARPNGAPSGSLGAIVGSFKSSVTRHINKLNGTPAAPVWQRDYWERIIRNDRALFFIRRYIANNPANWRKGSG